MINKNNNSKDKFYIWDEGYFDVSEVDDDINFDDKEEQLDNSTNQSIYIKNK